MRINHGLTLLAASLFPIAASAQTDRRIGVTLGHPVQVGVMWHVTDRVAVRPEVSFSAGSTETEIEFGGLPGSPRRTTTIEGDLSSVAIDLNLLITVKSWDAVRVNLVPSYKYLRTTSTSIASFFVGGAPPTIAAEESTSHDHFGGGALGVQFTPHQRFGIFAEAGLQYTSSVRGLDGDFKLKALGTAGTIGVVLYF